MSRSSNAWRGEEERQVRAVEDEEEGEELMWAANSVTELMTVVFMVMVVW